LKPKLLMMASLFFPQKHSGGPPVSLWNLTEALCPYYDIYIISKNHEINEKKPLPGVTAEEWNRFSFGKAYYLDYGRHTARNVVKLLKTVRPDIIYQNSFFSHDDIVPVWLYKSFSDKNVKVVVSPRGDFQENALKKGSLKKKAYIVFMRAIGVRRKFRWQVAAESEAKNLSELLGIQKEKIAVIPNLSSVGDRPLKSTPKEKGRLFLSYIARIHPHKNLDFALRSLKSVSGEIKFFIYGSIEDPGYWEVCKKEMEELPANIHCSYKGHLEKREVAQVLEQCHVMYLPSSSEAYGQSMAEAMLARTPVLISDQTPWTGINQANAGFALPLGDKKAFAAAVQKLADMGAEEYGGLSENAFCYIKNEIDTDKILSQYLDLFAEGRQR